MDFLQKIDGIDFVNGRVAKASPSTHFVFDDKSNRYVDLKDFFTFFKLKNENYDQFPFGVMDGLQKKQLAQSKFQSVLHSFSKIDGLDDFSPFDLIPFHIFENFAKVNYDFYRVCLENFKSKPIFDEFFDFYTKNVDWFHVTDKISGNFSFGRTGFEFAENFRFKSKENTFNLFHLGKESRHVVACDEDYFVYAPDYKQFEFRTFLKLINYDKSIFSESIYDFLGSRMGMPADKAKLSTISWLYSPYPNEKLDRELDKNILLNKIVNGCGNFGYPIYVGENSAPNKRIHTIVQSASQFIYIEKLHQVLSVLKDKRSKFVFPLHDCMIFFIHKSELELIEEIDSLMEDEVYKTKKYIGKNYRDIEEI